MRDLTWPRPGTAYLGLALDGSAAASLMSRHGLAIVHGPDGFVSSIGASWMRDDVPPGLLLDIGRPIPAPALPDCGP
ncbi:hypothetical protein [Streptomyces yaizuensis]|uniref:hypothetical protein n=1 Tax=Streptomyces yaizuensis TaxID=2989713 RepID=UPI002B1F969A|nr:hypothetical protein [Streptomyces sp. YSPA8]